MTQECEKPDCLHCAITFGAALCACGHNSFDHEFGPCEECPCLGVRGESHGFRQGSGRVLNPNVRTVLAAAANILCFVGLFAVLAFNWHLALVMWQLAFLCKWGECRILEKRLAAVGSVGGYPNQEGQR